MLKGKSHKKSIVVIVSNRTLIVICCKVIQEIKSKNKIMKLKAQWNMKGMLMIWHEGISDAPKGKRKCPALLICLSSKQIETEGSFSKTRKRIFLLHQKTLFDWKLSSRSYKCGFKKKLCPTFVGVQHFSAFVRDIWDI